MEVVHSKAELMDILKDMPKDNVVLGLMSSGDFNGLTKEDVAELI